MEVENLQDNLVTEWYGVSRLMRQFIPITFPYLTFQGFVQECKKGEENNKGNKGGGEKPPAFLGS